MDPVVENRVSHPHYNKQFFDERENLARRSACAVIPILVELIHPKSVIDVGCANGLWLEQFQKSGVDRICGVDGAYVLESKLFIPKDQFVACDLEKQNPQITDVYELAISLEVAEHLPESRAKDFVSFLCRCAPVVVFSAAVPFQGGVNHVNEQWPFYWEELFLAEGYIQLDLIRPRIWGDSSVAFWYRQNTFVYAAPEKAAELRSRTGVDSEGRFSKLHLLQEGIIHTLDAKLKELQMQVCSPGIRQCTQLWFRLPGLTLSAIIRRLRRAK